MKIHFTTITFIIVALLFFAMLSCSAKNIKDESSDVMVSIKPGTPSDVMAAIKTELEALGHVCEYSLENDFGEITCNDDDTYKTLIKYYEISKRIRFMSFFTLATPCDEIYHEVMTYNWEFNVAQASCQDDTIAFLSYTILPDGGINASEIHNFLEWWASSLVTSLKESGLWNTIN